VTVWPVGRPIAITRSGFAEHKGPNASDLLSLEVEELASVLLTHLNSYDRCSSGGPNSAVPLRDVHFPIVSLAEKPPSTIRFCGCALRGMRL
jgi:hypothetical protein